MTKDFVSKEKITWPSKALSSSFMQMLDDGLQGIYSPVVDLVCKDKDLHLEFKGNLDLSKWDTYVPRDEAVIVLYKGNRVFTIHRDGKLEMTTEFLRSMKDEGLPTHLSGKLDTQEYIRKFVPSILFNIASYGKPSMEIEYEQMLIRANNLERRVNSEYIMVYNQGRYISENKSDGEKDAKQVRFDVCAVKWPQHRRAAKSLKGQLVLIEVKYALNKEIGSAHKQLERYYEYLESSYKNLCREIELILRQKLTLGLIERDEKQIRRLEKLEVDKDLKTAEIVLFLVDYNPYSKYKNNLICAAKELPFSDQVRIADGGLAMWDKKRPRWERLNDD